MLALTLQGYGSDVIRLIVVPSLCRLPICRSSWLLHRWCDHHPGDKSAVDEMARAFMPGRDFSNFAKFAFL